MTNHQTQNAAVLDQFTQQAEGYAQLTRSARGSSSTPFLDAIGPRATDHVLDVACGNGRLTLMLAKLTQQVTGIDLTAAMLDQARALQSDMGVTNIEWCLGDVLPLPFPDGAFTLVVSQAAFHHLSDPAAVLAEMARVCAPDGRIAVNDLSPDPDKVQAFDFAERLRDPSHVHALPPEELRGLGQRAGLVETVMSSNRTARMPLAAVLATSFPKPGDMERVRGLYEVDARSGADALGLQAGYALDQITIAYPMTSIVWRHAAIEDTHAG